MIKGIIFDMDGVMIDTENQSNLGWLWAASQKKCRDAIMAYRQF